MFSVGVIQLERLFAFGLICINRDSTNLASVCSSSTLAKYRVWICSRFCNSSPPSLDDNSACHVESNHACQ